MKVPDVDIDPSEVEEALRLPDSFALDAEHPAARDPEHWALGPVIVTRDSGLIDQSNRDALVAHLRKDYAALRKDWRVTTCDHWGFGWVEHLSFRALNKDGSPTAIFRVLKSWFNALSDYPVADTNDLSKREYDAACERIKEVGYRHVRDGAPDTWVEEVFSWLWDNNQEALENIDEHGPCPTVEDVRDALRDLGYTDACPTVACVLMRGHEGRHEDERGDEP